MGIIAILTRECRLLSCQRDESREMRSGRVAHERDAIRIDAKLRSLGADELHRRLDVVDSAGIGLEPRLHQPVFDGEHGITVLRQIRSPVRVELAVTDLPAATMHADQYRCTLY